MNNIIVKDDILLKLPTGEEYLVREFKVVGKDGKRRANKDTRKIKDF